MGVRKEANPPEPPERTKLGIKDHFKGRVMKWWVIGTNIWYYEKTLLYLYLLLANMLKVLLRHSDSPGGGVSEK